MAIETKRQSRVQQRLFDNVDQKLTPHPGLLPARPTKVLDTYWRFAAERQEIFFRRLSGRPMPWTDDPIFKQYKFTNTYRASDRVSQYLIRNVIYRGDQSAKEIFFRILLFKMFNKIDTWELLSRELGELNCAEFKYRQYDRVLSKAMNRGERIYSAAYIMPSGSKVFGPMRKHQANLLLLKKMVDDDLASKIADSACMRDAFHLLLAYPMIGDFLAYQFVTDLNYSTLTNFSEMTFVVPGPGAIDGIHKCFDNLGGLTETDIIKIVAEKQIFEFERLGINFKDLWGRPLQLIDCQNLFCEISKYSRVFHPDVASVAGRTRIKQKYQTTPEPIDYWYPPKWGINELIGCERKL